MNLHKIDSTFWGCPVLFWSQGCKSQKLPPSVSPLHCWSSRPGPGLTPSCQPFQTPEASCFLPTQPERPGTPQHSVRPRCILQPSQRLCCPTVALVPSLSSSRSITRILRHRFHRFSDLPTISFGFCHFSLELVLWVMGRI